MIKSKSLLQFHQSQTTLLDTSAIVDNPELAGVIHAWTKIDVKWNPPEFFEEVPNNHAEQMELLWQYCNWDLRELAEAAGVTTTSAMVHFRRARILRYIMPDGTIPAPVRQALGFPVGEAVSRIRSGSRGRKVEIDEELDV